MKKILYASLFCLCCFTSCVISNPQLDPKPNNSAAISISGKIDCPSRTLTSLTPSDFTLTLYDTNRVELQTIRPRVDGTYSFDNLSRGQSFNIWVKRVAAPSSARLTTNQVTTYLNQNPRPVLSELALYAADVNSDGEVDGSDVVHINRYILEITPALPAGNWGFINSYILDSRNNFNFNAPTPLHNMQGSVTNFDFIMVQKGDMSLNFCN